MGSFTFKWEKPAEEVYVTGSFDNWTKSVKLEKQGDIFQKTVDLTIPTDTNKIQYKFVVDNQWVASDAAPKEADHEGNDNNVLTVADLQPTDPTTAILNTVTPVSTTAALAGQQPLEKTPEDKEPAPTPSDVPGGFPVTPADELNKTIGVNPLPAAAGAINPIQLAPGEKVPETIATQGINDNVKLDKESYEKSDALAGVDTQLPPVTSNLIPESSLPIGTDATINTVGAGATTTELAGQVPLEPKVPKVVKESQEKAGVEPEASAIPEEVKEKAEVESELKEKVPEIPPVSEGTAGADTDKSDILAAVTAAGAAVGATALGAAVLAKDAIAENAAPLANQASTAVSDAAVTAKDAIAENAAPLANQASTTVSDAAVTAKDTVAETAAPLVDQASTAVTDAASKNLPDSVKEQLPTSVQETLATKEAPREEVSPEVPSEVKESIVEAGESPEAAANTAAVEDKKAVESELLKEVSPAPAVDEAKPEVEQVKPEAIAAEVPAEVKESIVEAGKSPEAATNPEAVEDKKAVESELLKEVKPAPAADEAKPEVEAPKPADAVAAVPSAVKDSLVEADKSPEAAANAAAVEDKKAVESELLKEVEPVAAVDETKPEVEEPKPTDTVAAVPSAVKDSLVEADKSPEAAANAAAVEEKKAVESELLKEVKPVPAAETKTEEVKTAPALAEAKVEAPKAEAVKTEAPKAEAPANGTNGASSANGANGTSSKPAEAAAVAAAAAAGSSSSKPADTASTTTDKKKKHRISAFFSKLKNKLSDKH